MAVFIPTYFSPISQYAEILKAAEVVFEMDDNFQKQSYRNRCYIFNSNGKQLLNIAVKHPKKSARKKTKDAVIEPDYPWQSQHLKSLQTAYRNSPFYEFYEDDLQKIFEKKYHFLHDVLIDSHLFVTNALQISDAFSITKNYEKDVENDFRELAYLKKQPKKLINPYIQMFDIEHGFIPNLSVLDLIFMEGPNTGNLLLG